MLYSWDFGLRFDLEINKNDTEEYFQEVTKRASTIFRDVFNDSGKVFLVYMDYKYRRQKIRVSNFTFKQIRNLLHTEITYSKRLRLYEAQDRFDVRNMAIIKLTTDRISYKNILTAIANKEVYFIIIETKIIFHMYDDRGLELITADKESLRPIYQKYNK